MPYRTAEVELPEWKPREWGLARFLREMWDDKGPYARRVAVIVVGLMCLVLYGVTLGVVHVFIPLSRTTEADESWERGMRTQRRYQECVRRQGMWHTGEVMSWCSYDTRRMR